MPDTRHRWLLVDLGGFRQAMHCTAHDEWRHPFACFAEDGMLECVCGIDRARRPVAPVLDAEAVA